MICQEADVHSKSEMLPQYSIRLSSSQKWCAPDGSSLPPKTTHLGVRTREHQGDEDRLPPGRMAPSPAPALRRGRSTAQSCPHVQVQVQLPTTDTGHSELPARPLPDLCPGCQSWRRSQSGQISNEAQRGFLDLRAFFQHKTSGLKREREGFSSSNLHLLSLDYI